MATTTTTISAIELLDLLELEAKLRKLESLVWTTREGKKLRVHNRKELTDMHLTNLINYLEDRMADEEYTRLCVEEGLGGDWMG